MAVVFGNIWIKNNNIYYNRKVQQNLGYLKHKK